MKKNIVCIEHAWFSYGTEPVLKDINLSLSPLEFLTVIGPNGGGKTTLLKLLLGLLEPTQGNVQVLGMPPKKSRRHIGYVPQNSTIDSRFPVTVRDVVLMGRLGRIPLGRRYRGEDREMADHALQQVNMFEFRDRQIGKLSGGQQQRTFIARALVTQPQLLLLDEPTASVDSQIKRDIYDLLHELNTRITIMMISHDIGVVSSHAKTIACLNCQLFYHNDKDISPDMLAETYQCPVDLIAHGVPHRVLAPHDH
ncbi:ABC transporter [candidate division KSB3 bacterium]|uniref:ABC transporter n=1 Tax=candidate division KSB3 bacterium TaxID=2044937 RepID=A0A2G6KI43_9BACT|nr:MAG: ABC transporter [candidate division KSB3 bacterium]